MKYYLWDKDTDSIEETGDARRANEYLSSKSRFVDRTEIKGYTVSTVCLGLDHSFSDCVNPIIFETMIFDLNDKVNPYRDLYCSRYSTSDKAREGHAEAIKLVRGGF